MPMLASSPDTNEFVKNHCHARQATALGGLFKGNIILPIKEERNITANGTGFLEVMTSHTIRGLGNSTS